MSAALEALLASLAQHGERVALVQANQQLSYRQLLDEIGARAQRLHQVGAQRLGLALDNGLEWVLWDLATLSPASCVCRCPVSSRRLSSAMCSTVPGSIA